MELDNRGNYYVFSLTPGGIDRLGSSKLETDKITLVVSDNLNEKVDPNTYPKNLPRNQASKIEFKISRETYEFLQKNRQVTCIGKEVYVLLQESNLLYNYT